MSPRALAVVGTDTGVGKTVVTAAVALALRRAGLDPAVVKPVATGGGGCGAAGAVSGDARWLRRVLGLREPAEVVNPICWRAPLAPDEARRQEGAPQGAAGRSHLALRVFGDGRPLLLEGVGGVLVPVIGRITVADLVAELGVPALIVARAGLGTINHTLLTLEALRRRGVAIAGVVLNGARGRDPSERTNAAAIRRNGRIPVLATLPWIPRIRSDRRALAGLARRLPAAALARWLRRCG